MHFYGNQYPSDIEQKNQLPLYSGRVGPCIKLIFNSERSTFLLYSIFHPFHKCHIDGFLCAGHSSGCLKNNKDDKMNSFQPFVVLRCQKGVHIMSKAG